MTPEKPQSTVNQLANAQTSESLEHASAPKPDVSKLLVEAELLFHGKGDVDRFEQALGSASTPERRLLLSSSVEWIETLKQSETFEKSQFIEGLLIMAAESRTNGELKALKSIFAKLLTHPERLSNTDQVALTIELAELQFGFEENEAARSNYRLGYSLVLDLPAEEQLIYLWRCLTLGFVESQLQNPEAAKEHYDAVADVLFKHPDAYAPDLIFNLQELGRAYAELGADDNASGVFLEILKRQEQSGNELSALSASTLSELGDLLHSSGDKESVNCYYEAIHVLETIGDDLTLSEIEQLIETRTKLVATLREFEAPKHKISEQLAKLEWNT